MLGAIRRIGLREVRRQAAAHHLPVALRLGNRAVGPETLCARCGELAEESAHLQTELLGTGVAALYIFMQANVTGCVTTPVLS